MKFGVAIWPSVVDISAGNTHDLRKATPLLSEIRYINSRFNPGYVLAGAAYSSLDLGLFSFAYRIMHKAQGYSYALLVLKMFTQDSSPSEE